MPEPIDYRLDLKRKAKYIHCVVCKSCQWANPRVHGYCNYQGPFDGYFEDKKEPDKPA